MGGAYPVVASLVNLVRLASAPRRDHLRPNSFFRTVMIRSPSKGYVRATGAKRNRKSRPEETVIVLHEVLSRPGESDKPLNEQEFWVLDLFDFTESYPLGFVIQQQRVFRGESGDDFCGVQTETER